MIAWESNGQDGDQEGIYFQRYDAAGNAVGSETAVNTTTTDSQTDPEVSALVNGGFVIVWESEAQDTDGRGVYARTFDATGTATSGEILVNSHVAGNQDTAMPVYLTGGGFVVVWESNGQDGSGNGVYFQRFDDSGVAQGSETLVNTTTSGNQSIPRITATGDGGFIAVWHDDSSGNEEIKAQRFDSLGATVGGEISVNTYSTGLQDDADVTALTGGNLVIAWESMDQDGSENGIFGQIIDSSGNAVGSEFQVNSTTINSQQDHRVNSLPDGGFIVVWESTGGQDGDDLGIYAQQFDANGNKVNGEFQVNTTTSSAQATPEVTVLNDGRMVAVWESDGQDGAGSAIVARIFTSALDENATVGTVAAVSSQIVDPDSGDSYTYSLIDNAGGAFDIQSDGTITVLDSSLIDFENASTMSVTVRVTDPVTGFHDEVVTINLNNLAEAEQTVPGVQSVDEDNVLTFSAGNGNAITVTDTLATTDAPLQVTLSANDGILTLSQTTGLTFVNGSDGTSTFTFNGTESDINAALDGMTFTPNGGFSGAVTLNVTTELSADLAGHYTFESISVSGSTVNDQAAGVEYDGTLNGNAAVVNDATRGDVLSLDGSGDFVQIPGLIGEPANVTLSAWINASSLDTFGAVAISMGTTPALYLNASGYLEAFYESGGTNNVFTGNENLVGTGWRHVAMTIDDATREMAVYLDGQLIGTLTGNGPIEYDNSPDTYIGRAGDGGTGFDFGGMIDEARIYSRALTSDEIAALATDQTITTDNVSISVDAVNDQPVFNNLDGNPTFVEGSSAVVLDANVQVFDQELSSADNFGGSSLVLQRNGGANAEDVFSATGNLVFNGSSLELSSTVIGNVTQTSGSLILVFNSGTTNAQVNEVMQSIAYENTNSNPPADVQVNWSFNDGNTGAQGSGGNLSALGSTTVDIVGTASPADLVVPIAQSIDEDTVLTFSSGGGNAITVDSGSSQDPVVTVNLSVTNGTLTLSSTTGVSFHNGSSNGDGSLTISGSESDVNAALDGLQYQGDTDYNGADTLTVTTGSTAATEANIYARYEFNGGLTSDDSGNGYDGDTTVGDPSLTVDAERGDVMTFDGDDRIHVTNGTADLAEEVTISAWVNLDAGQQDNVFLSLGDEVYVILDPSTNPSYGMGGRIGSFTSYSLDSSDRVAGTGWRHVALTLDDANNQLRVYLDGELTRSSNYSGMDADWITAATQDIVIGGLSDGTQAFVGSIDDVRVYDSALSQSEIINIMGDNGYDSETVAITVNAVNDAPVFNALPSANVASVDDAVTNASVLTYGDLDNDGDLDLIGASTDGQMLWYANDGDGGFSNGTSLFNTASYDFTSIATGDLDGDGDLDFVVTNNTPDASEHGILVFENQFVDTGSTTFTLSSMESTSFGAYDVAIADIDGDTRLDIVASYSDTGEVVVYEQNTSDVFTRSVAASVAGARGIEVGTLNGDANLDIAVAGSSGVIWLENDGTTNPSFTSRTALSLSNIADVVIENLDGDSDSDIGYLRDFAFGTQLGWLENDGAATPGFTQNVITSLGNFSSFGNLIAGDFDGVGGVDLAISQSSSDEIRIFDNDGTGTFTEDSPIVEASGIAWIEAADVDGDGDLDLLSAQSGDSTFGIIFNQGSGSYASVHVNEDTTLNGLQIQIDDVDAGSADLEVTLTVTNGSVTIPTGSVTFSTGNSGSVVTFTGTVAEINSAINSFSFTPEADYFGTASIAIAVDDQGNTGSGGSQVANELISIEVVAVNDDPVILNANEITNPRFDTDLSGWTVTGNTDWEGNGEVRFGQIGGPNGTISQTFATVVGQIYYVQFDYGDRSATQSQSLNVAVDGTGSLLDEDVVSDVANSTLQPYTFKFVADSTSTTLTFSDTSADHSGVRGYLDNVEVRATANPTLSTLTFNEGDSPLVLQSWLPVGDLDDTHLSSAVVEISGNYVNGEDILAVTDQFGITSNFNASTGRLTLTGSAWSSQYETVLRTVTFENISESPTESTRSITFTVNDCDGNSNSHTRNVNVVAVNDDPTNTGTLPTDVTVTEDVLSNVDLSAVNFSDVDANGSDLTVTLSTSTGGQLTLAADGSLTFGGTANARTITGTLANLNAYFDNASNIQYLHGTVNTSGDDADSITVVVNDNGNTGTGGGTDQTLGTVNVDITNVNDAAVVATNTGISVNEGGSVVITTANLNEGDPDDDGADVIYRVRTDINGGTLLLNGTALERDDTFTQADVDAGLVSYSHTGGEDTTEAIRLAINDTGNAGETNFQIAVSITNQNDAPVAADDPTGSFDAATDVDTIGFWRLGESSGTTAVDASGSNDGTYNNVTLGQTGAVSGDTAADFSGSNSYVNLGNLDVSGTGITMAAWINADSFGGGDGRIFAKSDGTANADHTWMLSVIDVGAGRILETQSFSRQPYGSLDRERLRAEHKPVASRCCNLRSGDQ